MHMVNHVFLVALGMIVVVLATARTTRLATTDLIGESYRAWIEKHLGQAPQSKVSYMLTMCDWCNTFWTGLFWNTWALGASVWLADLDWRIALASLPPLTMATSYAASRLLESEGN
jgi:hypothetical protein